MTGVQTCALPIYDPGRIYVSSMDYWGDVNKVYSEFFGEHKPARIVLPVGRLNKGCLLELEATAEVHE